MLPTVLGERAPELLGMAPNSAGGQIHGGGYQPMQALARVRCVGMG
jgi:hypothetical protein